MAPTVYRKPRLIPDATEFLTDLTQLRQLVADLAARYSTLEETRRAGEAAAIVTPRDAAALCGDMAALDHEQMRVLLLNTKNRVLDVVTLYDGTLNSSSVRIAELFRTAIVRNAASILIVHNHPSGDPAPSPEDVRVTVEAVKAGKHLDILVLDHIIIGSIDRYVSLKERGLGF
jgi:DNA repair protein RadC